MKKIFLAVVLMFVCGCVLAQKPERDTAWMEVKGKFASFSFSGTDSATYYVDWGDGIIGSFFISDGAKETNLMTHTYSSSDTYTIKIWGEKIGHIEGMDDVNVHADYTEKLINRAGFVIDMDMVYVDGGTFIMGCTDEQGDDCYSDERPAHKVTLSGFYISKFEVTEALCRAVLGTSFDCQGMHCPACDAEMNVSWSKAMAFCKILSERTGKHYTLPTEAQWEFAARGGTKSKGYKYSGSNAVDSVAWYYENAFDQLIDNIWLYPKKPNELGLYNMSGNVWEWCLDWYGPYREEDVTNPAGPISGKYHVCRGGSFDDQYDRNGLNCRVSYRNYGDSGQQGHDDAFGFRVVCIP